MECPRCKVELKRTDPGEVGFVVIDICPQCEGSWLDKGELDALDDSVATNAELMELEAAAGEPEALGCPKCGDEVTLTALSPVEVGELVIDRCQRCEGFWLDEGELDRIRTALLDADSATNEDAEIYVKPASWSRTKWLLYTLRKAYGKHVESYGKGAGPAHRV